MAWNSIILLGLMHLKTHGFIEVFKIQLMKPVIKDFNCCVSADLYAPYRDVYSS